MAYIKLKSKYIHRSLMMAMRTEDRESLSRNRTRSSRLIQAVLFDQDNDFLMVDLAAV